MTVYKEFRVRCDHIGEEVCLEKLEVLGAPTITRARKLAREKRGWTSSGNEHDYCPKHSPATDQDVAE